MGIFKADGTRVTKGAFPSTNVDPADVPKVLTEDLFETKKYDLRNDTKPEGQIRTRFAKAGDVLTQKQIDALFPAPVVSTVLPASGLAAGGEVVSIEGQNLDGVTEVTFGGTPGTELTIQSDTRLTVKAPAHAAGAVDVVVTDDGGSATKTGAYTYA